jgi:hypothetical protein
MSSEKSASPAFPREALTAKQRIAIMSRVKELASHLPSGKWRSPSGDEERLGEVIAFVQEYAAAYDALEKENSALREDARRLGWFATQAGVVMSTQVGTDDVILKSLAPTGEVGDAEVEIRGHGWRIFRGPSIREAIDAASRPLPSEEQTT